MSGDLDVTMRLRLVQDVTKEAKRVADDLKKVDAAIDKLGKGNQLHLDKELRDVATAARQADQPITKLATDARKLNSIKTDSVEHEIKAIGTASRNQIGSVHALDRELGKLGKNNRVEDTNIAVGGLKTTIGAIGGIASGAMVGLLSTVALDRVIERVDQAASKYRDLEAAVALTQNTIEMRDPETRAKIMKNNSDLALRYGLGKPEVNKARDTLAAANVNLESQDKLLDPILKTARASGSSPEDISKAVIALKRNLGVKDAEVPLALDMMAKGAKLGSYELDNMAKNFPELAAMYSQSGRQGTPAVAELISYLQIMLEAAGTPDEASTNLKGFLDKIFSPDAVKNFKEKGVDLAKLKARADKTGASYPEMVFDELERLTKADPMKINELFGDREAKMAIQPQLKNRQRGRDLLKQVQTQSAGTVDKDWAPIRELDKTKTDQQQAAMDGAWDKIGQKANRAIVPFWERVARIMNPDYANMRWLEELPAIENQAKSQEKQLEAELAKLRAQQQEMGDGGTSLGPRINRIRAELQGIQEEKAFREEEKKRVNPEAAVDPTTTKSISADKPVKAAIGKDMSGAAEQSINGYNSALDAGLEKAVSMARDAAAKMQSMLSFTATPTISPNMVNPNSVKPASVTNNKQSSVTNTTNNRVTQNISTPSAVRASRLAVREQNRAVRMAQAAAYADMGAQPA